MEASCCRKDAGGSEAGPQRPVGGVLSVATPWGMMEGYLLTVRHGLLSTLRGLRPRFDRLRHGNASDICSTSQRPKAGILIPPRHLATHPIGAWNCLISSTRVWRQDQQRLHPPKTRRSIEPGGKRAARWCGCICADANKPASGGRRGVPETNVCNIIVSDKAKKAPPNTSTIEQGPPACGQGHRPLELGQQTMTAPEECG